MGSVYTSDGLTDSEKENHSDARPLADVLEKLRDEVGGLIMVRHGGRSRELALIITKLDEARLWAIEYGVKLGTHVVLDKREFPTQGEFNEREKE